MFGRTETYDQANGLAFVLVYIPAASRRGFIVVAVLLAVGAVWRGVRASRSAGAATGAGAATAAAAKERTATILLNCILIAGGLGFKAWSFERLFGSD